MSVKIHFASPVKKIGRREWRVIVYEYTEKWFGRLGVRFTGYQFRDPEYVGANFIDPAGSWKNEREYPSYNSNDSYAGLPKSLIKLYEKYEQYIETHMRESK